MFSLAFLILQYDNLSDKINSLENDSKLIRLEKEFLLEDITDFRSKLSNLKNSLKEYEASLDSTISKSHRFDDLVSNIRTDLDYREYIEFTFKYREYLIPELQEKKEIEEVGQKIILAQREYQIKELKIESKLADISRIRYELIIELIICFIIIYLSLKLAKKGFSLWQIKVQNPIDKKLKLEIELLKLDKNKESKKVK